MFFTPKLPYLATALLLHAMTFGSTAHADDVSVFLLAGQSNMSGRAPTSQLPAPLQAEQPDILFYYGGDGANPPSELINLRPGSGNTAQKFGPEIIFGRTVADEFSTESFAIIKHARGGTDLANEWDPETGNIFSDFQATVSEGLANITEAGHTPVIKGILWHQGESDTGNGVFTSNYEANLIDLIQSMRDEYGDEVPFFIGEIRRVNANSIIVADAQQAVAEADPFSFFVPADDLTFQDTLHFDAEGQIALGNRYAQAYIEAANTLHGDLNNDGFVGAEDIDIILSNWGDSVTSGDLSLGDADHSASVGQGDLDIVLLHWGEGTPPDVNIPEPASVLSLGSMILICMRRGTR